MRKWKTLNNLQFELEQKSSIKYLHTVPFNTKLSPNGLKNSKLG